MDAGVQQALKLIPQGVKDPDSVITQIASIKPAFYFFSTRAWESALASGALAHMDEEELSRFEGAYLSIKNYQDAQKSTMPNWYSAKAWFASHHSFTSSDLVIGEEKLRSMESSLETLQHLGGEFAGGLKETVGN